MNKNSNSTRFRPVEFCHVDGKRLEVAAVPEMMTGHAGAILIRKTEEKIGLVKELSRLVKDDRDQSKVKHSAFDILMQRECQIATGNADANDCDWLRLDGAIKGGAREGSDYRDERSIPRNDERLRVKTGRRRN